VKLACELGLFLKHEVMIGMYVRILPVEMHSLSMDDMVGILTLPEQIFHYYYYYYYYYFYF